MAPLLRLSAPILIAAGIALSGVALPALAATALDTLRLPVAGLSDTAADAQLAAHGTRQSRRQHNRAVRRRDAMRQRELERRRLRQRYPYRGQPWTNPRTGAYCWINRKGERQCYEGH